MSGFKLFDGNTLQCITLDSKVWPNRWTCCPIVELAHRINWMDWMVAMLMCHLNDSCVTRAFHLNLPKIRTNTPMIIRESHSEIHMQVDSFSVLYSWATNGLLMVYSSPFQRLHSTLTWNPLLVIAHQMQLVCGLIRCISIRRTAPYVNKLIV